MQMTNDNIVPKELALVTAGLPGEKATTVLLCDAFRGANVSVRKNSPIHSAITQTGEYTVSYPAGDMEDVVCACAGQDGATVDTLASKEIDAPRVKGSMGHLECRVKQTIDLGDHAWFIADPVHDGLSKNDSTRLYLLKGSLDGDFELKSTVARARYPQRMTLVVTRDAQDKPNVMTIGWSMYPTCDPWSVAIWIGKRGYTNGVIRETREFVCAIPAADMSREVSYCGLHSGRNVDKFAELGLETKPAQAVRPPLIPTCHANLECKLMKEVDAGSHIIFLGEILACYVEQTRQQLFFLGGPWDDLASYGPLP